jgi:beta-galactosidase
MTRNVRPGELRKIAFQSVGHGADTTIWFRWRSCTVGREQYWHGLLGHDGVAGRRYREAAATAGDLHRLEAALDGTTVEARIAIIYDYDSIWAVKFQKSYDKADYHANMRRYYNALTRRGLNCDMIRPGTPLDGYRIVVAPMLHVLADEHARQLVEFVAQGGVLVADHRSAVKDVNDKCIERTLPGLLTPALGIAIEEYESLSLQPGITYAAQGSGALAGTWTAQHWADWVQVRGAEAMATYTPWHMTAYALATRHRHGSGWGYYVGAVVAEDAFYDRLMAEVCEKAGVVAAIHPPQGVEVCIRAGGGRRLAFVINHTESPQWVTVPGGRRDLLTGVDTGGTLDLDRFGVAVLAL